MAGNVCPASISGTDMHWLIIVCIVLIALFALYVVFGARESLDVPVGPILTAQEMLWWDGIKMLPCSQCFDSKQCPNCPQFVLFTRPQQSIEGLRVNRAVGSTDPIAPTRGAEQRQARAPTTGGDRTRIEGFETPTPRWPIMPSPQDATAAALDARWTAIDYDTFDKDSTALANPMLYDMPVDYMTSREKMGACNTLSRSSYARAPFPGNVDASVLGTRNDDIFDGDRAVLPGRQMCRNSSSPVNRLLYVKTMGMANDINAQPSVDCTFMSHNGYSYKQRCDSSW